MKPYTNTAIARMEGVTVRTAAQRSQPLLFIRQASVLRASDQGGEGSAQLPSPAFHGPLLRETGVFGSLGECAHRRIHIAIGRELNDDVAHGSSPRRMDRFARPRA